LHAFCEVAPPLVFTGGFTVASEDVTVTLLEKGMIILAKNITASMKGLEFAFKKQTFPYVSGKGKLDATDQYDGLGA